MLKTVDVNSSDQTKNLVTTYAYDQKGNKIQETYQKGNYKTFLYDSKDRLIETCSYASENVAKLKTKYTYDSNDNLKSMVDYTVSGSTDTPYRFTYYEYDNLKRLVRFGEYNGTSPPARSESQETRYFYDIEDNLVKIEYPTGASKVLCLDFVYNANKWLTEIKITVEGQSQRTLRTYTYDRFGNVASIKDYIDPSSTSKYTLKTFTYDQYGRPEKLEIKDGRSTTTVQESYELDFDKAGNITAETILNNYHVDASHQGAETRTYSYDLLDQLTASTITRGTGENSSGTYVYDLVGNRLSEIKDGKQTTNVYNGLNQLVSSTEVQFGEEDLPDTTISEKAYSYDANGSQIQVADSITGETLEYTFDAANRLSTYVEKQAGVTTLSQTNQYNGNGQRIQKSETAGANPTDIVNYFYQDGQVLYTTGNTANKAFNILGAGDNVIATEHQNTSGVASYYFYNKDLRGSTTNILGSDYLSKASYTYDWFGNTEVYKPEGTSFYNQICYTGGVYDESTQLYYLNARFYDPADGRFLSQDTYRGTLEDANSWHLYAYCANNPVKYSDPSGHFVQLIIAGAFAAWTIYDAYKEYKSVKSKGYSNGRIALHMTGYVAKDIAFGKLFKSLKIGKRAVSLAKKVYKSKVVQKAIQKANASIRGRTTTHRISDASKKSSALDSYGGLSSAAEYGIKPYSALKNDIKGKGLEAHHILEKRLAQRLGFTSSNGMSSVALTKAEHQAFTNAWRKEIPYGTDYSTLSKQTIWAAAQRVYKDYPALLNEAKNEIFKN